MSERKRIYLCLAHMSEDGMEQKYVKEAFDTNWVVPLGPNVNGFEKDLETFVSDVRGLKDDVRCESLNKRVVALSSGTAAVHLGLLNCGVKPGDEVIVQSFTFCASTHPVTYLGATPVLVDSEPDTWNIDPELLEKAILDRKEKTGKYPAAIVPVALYGMPYKADRTTSGGGALITEDEEHWREIMMYATQYRESYPYYQHEKIGYNYRMSNICAGIGRGQMTVVNDHLAHHKHVQGLYEQLLADVKGVTVHKQPDVRWKMDDGREIPVYDSNYWLCTITIDENVKVKGQEDAYKTIVTGAVGGAAGVIHAAESAHTDCEPNANVEAMRVALDQAQIEARPVWKPMHKQPCYCRGKMEEVRCKNYSVVTSETSVAYVNGVSEAIFKVGMCLPAGPYVSDDDVRYIVDTIKENIIG